jgi:hypothetical protein
MLIFNNVALVIVSILASFRKAFRWYSSLHSELCDMLTMASRRPASVCQHCVARCLETHVCCIVQVLRRRYNRCRYARRQFACVVSHVILGIYLLYSPTFGVGIFVATPDVVLRASCRLLPRGPYLAWSGTFFGIGTIGVATPAFGLST